MNVECKGVEGIDKGKERVKERDSGRQSEGGRGKGMHRGRQ